MIASLLPQYRSSLELVESVRKRESSVRLTCTSMNNMHAISRDYALSNPLPIFSILSSVCHIFVWRGSFDGRIVTKPAIEGNSKAGGFMRNSSSRLYTCSISQSVRSAY